MAMLLTALVSVSSIACSGSSGPTTGTSGRTNSGGNSGGNSVGSTSSGGLTGNGAAAGAGGIGATGGTGGGGGAKATGGSSAAGSGGAAGAGGISSVTGGSGGVGTQATGGSSGSSGSTGRDGSAGASASGGADAGGGRTGTGGILPGSGGIGSGGETAKGGATGAGGQGGGGSVSSPWITFDPAGIVSRSNIVLTKPNSAANQLMPIGNGNLGAAVWAANGFTAQLNRADTMPDRKSPGQLTIPGLSKITGASDFKGTLNPYDGMLVESGGGMTARIYIRADSDELVVDVTGADPSSSQTASVSLWSGRSPTAAASGAIATLSESWTDSSSGSWSSNEKFGSLAALTAGGQNVKASGSGQTITVSFQPNTDGSFRVICGSPKFNGSTAAATVASQLLGTDATSANLEKTHTDWWHAFWGRVGLMKITTSDGSGEYFENLRAIFLYAHASESRGERPGSQAGVADFYNFTQDNADWYAAGYWFWNLRMQVAATLTSGAFDLNVPLFNLYSSNVTNIQAWTKSQMGGRAGICVPETMRFNGNGYWYSGNHSCDEASSPGYNALTLSSGSEIGLWMWRHYLTTQDTASLKTNFQFMLEAARFLHTYAKSGSDGKLHTSPTNAHENQWAVSDSINDVSAMRAFFPAVVAAAQVVGSTDSLVATLQADIANLPDLPRTNTARNASTTPSADSTNIFAFSTQPKASMHNSENDDLEPVWPYDLVSDADANLFAIGKRTYTARTYKDSNDWSNDAIQAARLGLGSEVAARMSANIGKYQVYACGLASWDTTKLNEPYIEQVGVIAAAINEAVATGFDGIIRLAPALPSNWSVAGTVYVQGKSRVHVQFVSGALVFGVLEAGSTGTVAVRNPWGTTQAMAVDSEGQTVVAATGDATLSISAQAGKAYLIKKAADATPSPVQVTGTAATAPKKLGSRTIGI